MRALVLLHRGAFGLVLGSCLAVAGQPALDDLADALDAMRFAEAGIDDSFPELRAGDVAIAREVAAALDARREDLARLGKIERARAYAANDRDKARYAALFGETMRQVRPRICTTAQRYAGGVVRRAESEALIVAARRAGKALARACALLEGRIVSRDFGAADREGAGEVRLAALAANLRSVVWTEGSHITP